MKSCNKTFCDLRNEKYAGVSYPIPPKASEIEKLEHERLSKDLKKKKEFGKILTINFFSRNKKN